MNAALRTRLLGIMFLIGAVLALMPLSPFAEIRNTIQIAVVVVLAGTGLLSLVGEPLNSIFIRVLIWCHFFVFCLLVLGDPEALEGWSYDSLSYVFLGWISLYSLGCLYLIDGEINIFRSTKK